MGSVGHRRVERRADLAGLRVDWRWLRVRREPWTLDTPTAGTAWSTVLMLRESSRRQDVPGCEGEQQHDQGLCGHEVAGTAKGATEPASAVDRADPSSAHFTNCMRGAVTMAGPTFLARVARTRSGGGEADRAAGVPGPCGRSPSTSPLTEQVEYPGEGRPRGVSASGDGIGPQGDLRVMELKESDPGRRRSLRWE